MERERARRKKKGKRKEGGWGGDKWKDTRFKKDKDK